MSEPLPFPGYTGDCSDNWAVLQFCRDGVVFQGAPAFENGYAWYKAPCGLRGPCGWLIPDSDYQFDFESQPCGYMYSTVRDGLPQTIGEYFMMRGFNMNLLEAMQEAHDDALRVSLQRADIRDDWLTVWLRECERIRSELCPST